jgi:streptogramin lyase
MRIPTRCGCILSGTAALTLLAGCWGGGAGSAVPTSAVPRQSNALAGAPIGHWRQIHFKGATGYGGAAASPDGRSVWFAMARSLARVDVNGQVRHVPVPYPPESLAFGKDGRLYTPVCCTLSGDEAVMAVTTAGAVSVYVPPSKDLINDGVTLGPDGNIWVSESTHVAKITPSGTFTEYKITLPPNSNANNESGIAAGPNGTVWFPIVDDNLSHPTGYLARIHTANGHIDQMSVPCFNGYPLVLGADGNFYERCPAPNSSQIGILRVSPAGHQRLYQDPYGVSGFGGQVMTTTPNGLIWAITFQTSGFPSWLSALDPKSGKVQVHQPPAGLAPLSTIAQGPGQDIWALSQEIPDVGIFHP